MPSTRYSKSDDVARHTNYNANDIDVVERIIEAVEARGASSHETSVANSRCDERVEGGPFTNVELSQMSFIPTNKWRDVEGDTLVSLTGMLFLHVGSAATIDLVAEGRDVVKKKEDGEPVITLQQVRWDETIRF